MSDPKVPCLKPAARWRVRIVAIAIAMLAIAVATWALPYGSPAAALLLDRQPFSIFPYPFTIQNLVYIVLAWALGELYLRWRTARREHALLRAKLLPEDSGTVLQLHELGPIRRRIADLHDAESGFLPSLMDLAILQLQASGSVDQALNIVTNALNLLSDRVDLRYQMIRYMAWLIPTIGFLGTVVGISLALDLIQPDNLDLGKVVGGLSVSFYTTLVALIASAILSFVQHMVQEMEETALNEAGQYCLRNLVNRIYIEPVAPQS